MIRRTVVIVLGFILTGGLVDSGSAQFGDRNIEVHGYLLGNYAGRTTGLSPAGGRFSDFMLSEERLRLDIETWSEAVEAAARIRLDMFHDALGRDFDIDLREAYINYTAGPFDFTLGRQIVTWGVGDLIFINDVFPKDWESFFLGRPLEYLKFGVDGLRMRLSSGLVNADILAVPTFEPDNLPGSDRFFLFDPLAAISSRREQLPGRTFENTELAVRVYRYIWGFDVSGYAYKGFWRSPGMMTDDPAAPTEVMIFYPELFVYGFSAQGRAPGGVVSLEAGYYDSRDDSDGADPSIPNSQVRFLIGYQRQMWEDFNAGVQYHAERMQDHETYTASLPGGFPEQSEYRDTVTLRLTQLLKHQTLKLSFFGFYSPADTDYLLQPSITYKFADSFSTTIGGNIFGGKEETTFLGQFEKNDNTYLSALFTF
ncbi:MAG: hypothetical protein GTO51_00915 [Candidatus Latescibacteria bacterium]|nr:hypothetical protein [Candidatus Latescibacterota bacterium]NIM21284.1 hypothetical protein [Candidatus Latescibacterota bacterium]NIM64542.1 hypothetical protein [Candidatus Latescibacterota bacterium]NIO00699.1 hypothetical protein [Candidatus Latescibacterota bacterium]NIO27098.1 hypothetical protein [Candidatus Latescibacterota bacterium]